MDRSLRPGTACSDNICARFLVLVGRRERSSPCSRQRIKNVCEISWVFALMVLDADQSSACCHRQWSERERANRARHRNKPLVMTSPSAANINSRRDFQTARWRLTTPATWVLCKCAWQPPKLMERLSVYTNLSLSWNWAISAENPEEWDKDKWCCRVCHAPQLDASGFSRLPTKTASLTLQPKTHKKLPSIDYIREIDFCVPK